MRTMRRAALVMAAAIAGVVLLLGTVAMAWGVRERARDPLSAIHRAPGDVRVAWDSSYEVTTGAGEARVFRELVLETTGSGTVRITTSRPALDPAGPMPLVVVLGGLRTGRESLGHVDEHGPNLLVGYEYPYSQETFYEGTPAGQVPIIRRAVLDVPSQVALVARHLAADPMVDAERTALLGFSFGALFVPAVQRVATEDGHPFDALILAYGGADLGPLLDANLKIGSRAVRRGLSAVGSTLLHPLEPRHHLPRVGGRFLLISGDSDRQIPLPLAQRLASLTPEPKEVVVLPAGHMGPRDPELTARVVSISQDWLERQGVIDPAVPAPGGRSGR